MVLPPGHTLYSWQAPSDPASRRLLLAGHTNYSAGVDDASQALEILNNVADTALVALAFKTLHVHAEDTSAVADAFSKLQQNASNQVKVAEAFAKLQLYTSDNALLASAFGELRDQAKGAPVVVNEATRESPVLVESPTVENAPDSSGAAKSVVAKQTEAAQIVSKPDVVKTPALPPTIPPSEKEEETKSKSGCGIC